MTSSSKSISTDPHSIPLLSVGQGDEEQQVLNENQTLYLPEPPSKRSPLNRYSWIVAPILLVIFIGLLAVPKPSHKSGAIEDDYDNYDPVPDSNGICKQSTIRPLPDDDISRALIEALNSEKYLRGSVERLAGAIGIRTESFDDMGPVGHDPRWDVFGDFHAYLATTYPKVYIPREEA